MTALAVFVARILAADRRDGRALAEGEARVRRSTKLAELLSEPEKGTERAETARLEPAAGS